MQNTLDKNTKFSERLRQVIDYYGVSSSEFAENLGYQRAQSIYDFLNGKVNPSFGFFQSFAKSKYSASINYNWLLTGDGDMIDSERAAKSGYNVTPAMSKENTRPWEEGMRLMKMMDMDEVSAMESLISHKANELMDMERTRPEHLSVAEILEKSMQALKDLYVLARKEGDRVKFFGGIEYIKEEDTCRFFSLGKGRFLLLTIMVGPREASLYFDKFQNNRYLIDFFPRHAATIDSLYFGEYRSFEVGVESVGATCLSRIKPGNVVTGKKVIGISGRQMEFIEGSECIMVFHGRIIFTKIIEWDTLKGSGLYDDPQQGATKIHVNDLLEIYIIEIVTQKRDR